MYTKRIVVAEICTEVRFLYIGFCRKVIVNKSDGGNQMFEKMLKVLKEELILLRKLMIEYWKDSEDAKDGIVDLEMSFEKWSEEYIGELMQDFPSEGYIEREVRNSIKEYIERLM